MDDHSTAQTVINACTFFASLLSSVAEKASLTWHWRAIENKVSTGYLASTVLSRIHGLGRKKACASKPSPSNRMLLYSEAFQKKCCVHNDHEKSTVMFFFSCQGKGFSHIGDHIGPNFEPWSVVLKLLRYQKEIRGVSNLGWCHYCGVLTAWSLSHCTVWTESLTATVVKQSWIISEITKMKCYDFFNLSSKLPLRGDEMSSRKADEL